MGAVILGLSFRPVSRTEWEHFSGNSVSFVYPEQWTIENTTSATYGSAKQELRIVTVAPEKYGITQFAFFRNSVQNYDFVDEAHRKDASFNLEITEEQIMNNVKNNYANAEIKEIADLTIGQYPAKKVTVEADLPNSADTKRILISQYAVNVGNDSFLFTTRCSADDKSTEKIFSDMLKTIEFTTTE